MPDKQAPVEIPELNNSNTAFIDSSSSESESTTLSDHDFEIDIENLVSSSSEADIVSDIGSTSSIFEFDEIPIPLYFDLRTLLIKITETENLEIVTKLHLRVIARDVSLQRLPLFLPNLRELNLNGSCLMTLRDLGCEMQSLKILHVARTGLNSLDGLFGLCGLVELYAASNNIQNVCQLSALPNIHILDIAYNDIKDTNTVSFLTLCTTLKHLRLEGNPTSNIENYRKTIQKILPNILSLDGIDYIEEEDETPAKIISRFPPILLQNPFKRPIKRPYTTGSIVNLEKIKFLPRRPSTAQNATTYNDFSCVVSGCELKLNDILAMFIPSKLTSGKPICGNPALGLWEKKQLQAWDECFD